MPSNARASLISLAGLVAVAAACGSTAKTVDVPAGAGITTLSPPPPVVVPNDERLCRKGPGVSALVPFDGPYLVSTNLLVDHDYAYFTSFDFIDENHDTYYLMRVTKRGDPPERLAVAGAESFVTDGTTIYAADTGGAVTAFPASGRGVSSGASAGAAIAADAVYVASIPDGTNGMLLRVPLDGSRPTFADRGQDPAPWSVLVDGSTVYWQANFWYGPVFAQGPTGAARRVVPGNVRFPSGFALDGDTLFLGVNSVGIVTVPKSGGDATTLAAGVDARGILVDGDWVYWLDEHSVHLTPKTGGPDIVLATILPSLTFKWESLVSDEDCLYFAVQDEWNRTALLTTPKPTATPGGVGQGR